MEDIPDIQNTNLTNKETKISRPETKMTGIKKQLPDPECQVLLRRLRYIGVEVGGSRLSLRKNGKPLLFVGPWKFNTNLNFLICQTIRILSVQPILKHGFANQMTATYPRLQKANRWNSSQNSKREND